MAYCRKPLRSIIRASNSFSSLTSSQDKDYVCIFYGHIVCLFC